MRFRSLLVLAVAVAAALGSAAASDAPLRVWKSFTFPPLFRPQIGVGPAGPGTVVAVSVAGFLTTLDARTGSLIGSLKLDSPQPLYCDVREWNGRRRAIVGASPLYGDPTAHAQVIDLDDPAHPRSIATTATCGAHALVLPGVATGLVYGDACANLVDLEDGSILSNLGGGVGAAAATIVDGVSVLLLRYDFGGTGSDVLQAFDVSDPRSPSQLWYGYVPHAATLALDRRGALLAATAGGTTQLRDLRSGAVSATIEAGETIYGGAFVDSGSTHVLALAKARSVAIFDVADPRNPRLSATVAARVYSPGLGYAAVSGPLRAHPDRPWLAIATEDPVGFLVADARDGSIVSRYAVDNAFAVAIDWLDLADGTPALAFSGGWFVINVPRPEGGVVFTDTVPVGAAEEPERVARYAPVAPQLVEKVLPVGGRYAAAIDVTNNAIALVDTSDGTVSDTAGFPLYLGGPTYQQRQADAAGATFAVQVGRGVDVFDVVGGRLHRRPRIEAPAPDLSSLQDMAVAADGSVVALWLGYGRQLVAVHRRDGRVETLDPPAGSYFGTRLALDPSRKRAVLSFGPPSSSVGDVAVVALDDPGGLRLLWSEPLGAAFADFVRDGATVAATFRDYDRFSLRLFDAATGTPLGDEGPIVNVYYELSTGAGFGSGGGGRIVYSNKMRGPWVSTLFDVSGDTPTLVAVSGEYPDESERIARDDGATAFDLAAGAVRVVRADGTFEPFATLDARGVRRLRHGFYTSTTEGFFHYQVDRTARLLRDVDANRPPAAKAGGDRAVECGDRAGTPVALDAGGSSDPDSSPGTEDDIDAYAWSVDGAAAGSAARATVSLPIGPHHVALAVTDRLGAASTDVASVDVVDTLPPDVSVALSPRMETPGPWSHEWSIAAEAIDRCDGSLAPAVVLTLPVGSTEAPYSWTAAAGYAVEIGDDARGTRVHLFGPDRATSETYWHAAIASGGFAPSGSTIRLETATIPPPRPPRGLVARFDLDGSGRVAGASAYGPGADLFVAASATDAAGHAATSLISLRAAIAGVCADAPGNLACLSTSR